VAEKQTEKTGERSILDLKLVATSLLEESGEVAPVDFRRFGKCAGEIIARAARPGGKPQKYQRQ
jgi:hypothetical protein